MLVLRCGPGRAAVIAARERQPTNSNSILGMACQQEQGASPVPATSRPRMLGDLRSPAPWAAISSRGPQRWPGDTPEPPMARNPAIGGGGRLFNIRRCLRISAFALVMGSAGLLTVPAAASTASPASPGAAASPGTAAQPAGARQRPWIAITSVTPGYARPTGKITISGIV